LAQLDLLELPVLVLLAQLDLLELPDFKELLGQSELPEHLVCPEM
jgi:hypothetical protein